MELFKKKKTAGEPERTGLPRHIAIIMDGNGRWAKKRGLPRTAGHAAGAENFRKIARYCRDVGIEYLTVYAFSTENWSRPDDEVNAILGILENYLEEAMERMRKENIRVKFFGNPARLSPKIQELIKKADEISRDITGCQVNVCFNYGARDEMVRAMQTYAEEVKAGRANDITEADVNRYLYSADIPDPDLIIRPGGECRLSNFLLWQCAYAEFYFCDTYWPDFDEAELDKALEAFSGRQRRFGKVK
ncbi:MAG: isoprenyl transferase [Oscillospiraceae bacterium]|nr:isoprenyl transferase [Oscillospiraceae bacterium]